MILLITISVCDCYLTITITHRNTQTSYNVDDKRYDKYSFHFQKLVNTTRKHTKLVKALKKTVILVTVNTLEQLVVQCYFVQVSMI